MSYEIPAASIVLTVEIQLPGDLSDELQDAIVDDLTYEGNIEILRKKIKNWARTFSGENCHIEIDVE